MTEPAAVALRALRRGGGTGVGETVAVLGGGAIGLLAALWARLHGATRILAFDIDPAKLDLAHRLGFLRAFDAREKPAAQRTREWTDGDGAHLVIEAAGVPATTVQAIEAARHGGRIILLGNPSAPVTLPPVLISRILRRELAIRGTWNSVYRTNGADDWHAAVEAMDNGGFDPVPLITHRVSLEEALPVLERVRDHGEFAARVLIGTGPVLQNHE